jgi:hypothetical protein
VFVVADALEGDAGALLDDDAGVVTVCGFCGVGGTNNA